MFNAIDTDLIHLIEHFASILRPDAYLELGIYKAETISKVSKFAKQAIGVDIIKPQDINGFTFYHMSTDTFFCKIELGEIIIPTLDMVFIDACHSHEQSLKDFNNVFKYVSEGGLIFLHDTYPKDEALTNQGYCGDVYRTAWKIRMKKKTRCEIVTIPASPGMSIVRKSSKQLLWT